MYILQQSSFHQLLKGHKFDCNLYAITAKIGNENAPKTEIKMRQKWK